MPIISFHPASRLLFWIAVLVTVQGFSGRLLLATTLLVPFCGKKILLRGTRLVWRARWLFLALVTFFSWGTAGDPLWAGWGAPTREGMAEAMVHSGRLFLVLIGVAALLENLPLAQLLSASHKLLGVFRRVGLDPDRGVVRLMLVLHYVETLPRPDDWRSMLSVPAECEVDWVDVVHEPLAWPDFLMLGGIASMFIIFGLNQAI